MGVAAALILDYKNPRLAEYGGGIRFMIFMLETANTRFAGKSVETIELLRHSLSLGFATIDISMLTQGTLIIFVLLMGVKPQMVCSLLFLVLKNKDHYWFLVMCDQRNAI